MKYFITEEKRKGTCYFEFQKGKFKGKFWLQDSLYLHGDKFDELTPWAKESLEKHKCFTICGI